MAQTGISDFEQFDEDYRARVLEVNATLLKYGWVINPHHVMNKNFEELLLLTRDLETSTESDRKAPFKRINRLIVRCTCHPRTRAFQLRRSTQLPHLQDFAHYLERALLHYYKRDYFSSVLVMLPAIEGTIRSHIGWSGARLSYKQATAALLKRPTPMHGPGHAILSSRFPVYRDLLVNVLDEWLYKPTNVADFELSYLNRHYALHGLGQGSFYSAADCHRLFALIDLYVEVLSCETGLAYSNFLPDVGTDEFVDARTMYYLPLLLAGTPVGDAPANECIAQEELFMTSHGAYHPESDEDGPGKMFLEDIRPQINRTN